MHHLYYFKIITLWLYYRWRKSAATEMYNWVANKIFSFLTHFLVICFNIPLLGHCLGNFNVWGIHKYHNYASFILFQNYYYVVAVLPSAEIGGNGSVQLGGHQDIFISYLFRINML